MAQPLLEPLDHGLIVWGDVDVASASDFQGVQPRICLLNYYLSVPLLVTEGLWS